jgi:hypothetical protein
VTCFDEEEAKQAALKVLYPPQEVPEDFGMPLITEEFLEDNEYPPTEGRFFITGQKDAPVQPDQAIALTPEEIYKVQAAEADRKFIERRAAESRAIAIAATTRRNSRELSPMNEHYMKQMTAMMVCANLFNGAPGRSPKETAKVAVQAAHHLWEEWCNDRNQPQGAERK